MAKVVAVFGSTGAQGGGVVRGLSGEEGYEVRAITRSPDGEKAKALAALPGVTVVKADMDDAASVEAAVDGAYGVFCVTNFWEHFSAQKETDQATAVANACKAKGVQHVVWSTLDSMDEEPDMDPCTDAGGKTSTVPHFDGKAAADAAFEGLPVTKYYTSWYFDNMIYFGMGPKRGEGGKLALTFPFKSETVLPGIAAQDIGQVAAGIFKDPSLVGKSVYGCGERLTGPSLCAALSEALGEEVAWNPVPADAYRGFGFPGAKELGNMFEWQERHQDLFVEPRDPAASKALHPGLLDMKAWLAQHAKSIPL